MAIFGPYRKSLAPPWLSGPNGHAWADGLGAVEDSLIARTKEAVKASFPHLAPADALDVIGRELGLPRGLTAADPAVLESDTDYRARLTQAFDQWAKAGTAQGLIDAIKLCGFTNVRIYTTATLKAACGYVPDGRDDLWARAWIVITPPQTVTPVTWGSFSWGDGTRYGSTATPGQINSLLSAVTRWRPGHVRVEGIWWCFGPSSGHIASAFSAPWAEDKALFYESGTSGATTSAFFIRYADSYRAIP